MPMEFEQYQYVDVAIGGPFKRNNVQPITQVYARTYDEADCYHTIYRYAEPFKTHVAKTGSVKGYTGPYYTRQFVVDIDSDGETVADAVTASRTKVINLLGYWRETFGLDARSVTVFFSGGKGFHLLVPSIIFGGWHPSDDLAERHKALAARICIEGDYDAAIYDRMRLLRIVNTKHSKSGLFKIALPASDVIGGTVAGILERAKTRQPLPTMPECDRNEPLTALWRTLKTAEIKKPPITSAYQPAGAGGRTPNLMRICGSMMKDGVSMTECLEFARWWNSRNQPPHDDSKIVSTVESAFRQYQETGETDATDEDEIGQNIHRIADGGKKYQDFLARSGGRLIKLGMPPIDNVIRGIYPGQVLGIEARTRTFKTAIVQNILHQTAHEHKKVLFFSLEMQLMSLFERAVQMELELTGDQIQSIFAGTSSMQETPEDIIRFLHSRNSDFYVVDRAGMSLVKMKKHVDYLKTHVTGGSLDLVAIDYMQRVSSQGRSRVEVVGGVARGIKDFAKEIDCPVIILIQIARDENDNRGRLKISSGRDSGEIEESVDFLLGQYIDPTEEGKIHVQILKNRQGPERMTDTNATQADEFLVTVDTRTLRIYPVWEPF